FVGDQEPRCPMAGRHAQTVGVVEVPLQSPRNRCARTVIGEIRLHRWIKVAIGEKAAGAETSGGAARDVLPGEEPAGGVEAAPLRYGEPMKFRRSVAVGVHLDDAAQFLSKLG